MPKTIDKPRKTFRDMRTQGQLPKRDYNALIDSTKIILEDETAETENLPIKFSVQGALIAGTNVAKKLRINRPFTIREIAFYIETTSSLGSVVVDVNQSDSPTGAVTSLFPIGIKPTIAAAATEDIGKVPDNIKIEAGKYISIDIDSNGTGAKDLTLILYGR